MVTSLTTQALKNSQASLLQMAAGQSAFPDVTSLMVALYTTVSPMDFTPTSSLTWPGAMEPVVDMVVDMGVAMVVAMVVAMEAATVVMVVVEVAAEVSTVVREVVAVMEARMVAATEAEA